MKNIDQCMNHRAKIFNLNRNGIGRVEFLIKEFLASLLRGYHLKEEFEKPLVSRIQNSTLTRVQVAQILSRANKKVYSNLATTVIGYPAACCGEHSFIFVKAPKIFFLSLWFLILIGGTLVLAQTDTSGNLTEALKTYTHLSKDQKDLVGSSIGMPDLSGFSMAKMIAWLIFGAVGFVAFNYGRKQSDFKVLTIGVVLMGYPYFVNDTFWLYAVGVGLCALLYFWHD